MIQIRRTNSKNADFVALVASLDAELSERDGADHAFYDQFNKIEGLKYTVVLYDDLIPEGCGAIKAFSPKTMEIKRMFVRPNNRGKGFASRILAALEEWAVELQCKRCILETGKRQPEAIQLYQNRGYQRIPNYGQYAGIENSLCFEKKLKFR
ncbi:MAG TPA: GNAT family N-acetyltransferase [Eudoraea sp.]|nr:GNAT family N-acetyltransferase [Eudoraea sp.]